MTRKYKRRSYHAMTGTREYRVWWDMMQRCRNPKLRNYHLYGGRGIRVCLRWFEFLNFYMDMGNQPADLELDRINTNGNYEPKNCRWATREQGANNTRCNVRFTYKGESLTIPVWARRYGLNTNCLDHRIKAGWPMEKALTVTPKRGNHALRLASR